MGPPPDAFALAEALVAQVDRTLGTLNPAAREARPSPEVRRILQQAVAEIATAPRVFLGLLASTQDLEPPLPHRDEAVELFRTMNGDVEKALNFMQMFMASLGGPQREVRVEVPYLMVKQVRERVIALYLLLHPGAPVASGPASVLAPVAAPVAAGPVTPAPAATPAPTVRPAIPVPGPEPPGGTPGRKRFASRAPKVVLPARPAATAGSDADAPAGAP